jgi:tRNA (guanine-N7-)-methyltransferase
MNPTQQEDSSKQLLTIDYKRYPYPRTRHHTNPQFYIPYNELHIKPSSYPPLYTIPNSVSENTDEIAIQWTDHFTDGKPPTRLDIGCGWGKFLLETALASPTTNILGIETRQAAVDWINGVIHEERKTSSRLNNASALWYSVVNGLDFIAEDSVEYVTYFFPDPWFKKRHHKRRAFNDEFLNAIRRVLAPSGRLYLMTDIPEVDAYQREVLSSHKDFYEVALTSDNDWFNSRTDQEETCIRNGIGYVRSVFQKNG